MEVLPAVRPPRQGEGGEGRMYEPDGNDDEEETPPRQQVISDNNSTTDDADGRKRPAATASPDNNNSEDNDDEEEGEINDDKKEDNNKKQKVEKDMSTAIVPHNEPEAKASPSPQPKQKKKTSKDIMAILNSGVYIPPGRRDKLKDELEKLKQKERQEDQDQKEDQQKTDDVVSSPSLEERINQQRQKWHDQKKIVNGTINRLNSNTIKPLIHDLFDKVNLIWLRGVLAKSVLQASIISKQYSNVYAALVAVINSKLPEIGELIVNRSVLSFQRYYRRKDKSSCLAMTIFLGHLFHQNVIHELLILQILMLLLEGDPTPTDDSVEVVSQFLPVVGQKLIESSPAGVRAVIERLRSLLHEGTLNSRVEYKIEQLLSMRKSNFHDYPSLLDELDLVNEDDQITFDTISLDDTSDLKQQDNLNVFNFDDKYQENEHTWSKIRAEILGLNDSDDDSDEDSETTDDSSEDEEDKNEEDHQEEEETNHETAIVPASSQVVVTKIQDLSESDLIHLRRTIYLTIMSSATFEECTHKLTKVNIPFGREEELVNMILECCSQEKTFLRYYGLICARFCLLDNRWTEAFLSSFAEQYSTIHRLETNKLRNVAKLFAHLIHTDSVPWSCLSSVHLNEDETTSSSRIFLKILLQEMAEAMGIAKLKGRFEKPDDPQQAEWYKGMFPKDNVRNTRYAINFFTSIGLGPLTDELREYLKNAPKLILLKAQEEAAAKAALAAKNDDDDSSSVSSSSSSSSDSSSSMSTSSYTSSSTSSSSSSSSTSSSSSSSSYSSRGRRSRRGRRRSGSARNSQSRRNRRSPSHSSESSSDESDSSRSRSSYSSYSSDSRSSSSGSTSRSGRGRDRRRSRSTDNGEDRGHKKNNSRSSPDSYSSEARRGTRRRNSPSSSSSKRTDEEGSDGERDGRKRVSRRRRSDSKSPDPKISRRGGRNNDGGRLNGDNEIDRENRGDGRNRDDRRRSDSRSPDPKSRGGRNSKLSDDEDSSGRFRRSERNRRHSDDSRSPDPRNRGERDDGRNNRRNDDAKKDGQHGDGGRKRSRRPSDGGSRSPDPVRREGRYERRTGKRSKRSPSRSP